MFFRFTGQILAVVACLSVLGGCAAGSATAGYSITASSADELKQEARSRIIQEAVDRAKAALAEDLSRQRAAILAEAEERAVKVAEEFLERAVDRLARESRESAEDYLAEQLPKLRHRLLQELELQSSKPAGVPSPAQNPIAP